MGCGSSAIAVGVAASTHAPPPASKHRALAELLLASARGDEGGVAAALDACAAAAPPVDVNGLLLRGEDFTGALPREAAADAAAVAPRVIGRTALMLAAEAGSAGAARRLLAAGASISASDASPGGSGFQPVHFAAAADQPEVLKLLIDIGPAGTANAPSARQWTPLHCAASAGADAAAAVLLARGADLNGLSAGHQTPLGVAASHQAWGVARQILSAPEPSGGLLLNQPDRAEGRTELFWTVVHKNMSVAAALVARGADPLFADRRGRSMASVAGPEAAEELERMATTALRLELLTALAGRSAHGASSNASFSEGSLEGTGAGAGPSGSGVLRGLPASAGAAPGREQYSEPRLEFKKARAISRAHSRTASADRTHNSSFLGGQLPGLAPHGGGGAADGSVTNVGGSTASLHGAAALASLYPPGTGPPSGAHSMHGAAHYNSSGHGGNPGPPPTGLSLHERYGGLPGGLMPQAAVMPAVVQVPDVPGAPPQPQPIAGRPRAASLLRSLTDPTLVGKPTIPEFINGQALLAALQAQAAAAGGGSGASGQSSGKSFGVGGSSASGALLAGARGTPDVPRRLSASTSEGRFLPMRKVSSDLLSSPFEEGPGAPSGAGSQKGGSGAPSTAGSGPLALPPLPNGAASRDGASGLSVRTAGPGPVSESAGASGAPGGLVRLERSDSAFRIDEDAAESHHGLDSSAVLESAAVQLAAERRPSGRENLDSAHEIAGLRSSSSGSGTDTGSFAKAGIEGAAPQPEDAAPAPATAS